MIHSHVQGRKKKRSRNVRSDMFIVFHHMMHMESAYVVLHVEIISTTLHKLIDSRV